MLCLPRSSSVEASLTMAPASASASDSSFSNNSVSTNEPSSTLGGSNYHESDEESLKLAQDEQRAVVLSKAVVAFTLICAATALGLVTFLLTSQEEEDDFKSQVSDPLYTWYSLL